MLISLYIAPVLSLTFAHSSYNVQFMLISAVHLSKTSVTYTPSFCKHVLLKTEMLLSFLITNTHTHLYAVSISVIIGALSVSYHPLYMVLMHSVLVTQINFYLI